VILNGIAGCVFGVAFGLFGDLPTWLIAGTLFGVLLGLANEVLFGKVQRLAKLRRIRLILLVLSEMLLVMYVGFPGRIAHWVTHPSRMPVVGTPADVGLIYEEATIPTTDGVVLQGWYVPSRNRAAIIALHGYNRNRVDLLPYAEELAEHGYGVLMLDLRAHGESGGEVFRIADPSPDVKAAVAFLRDRPDVDPERIGALGRSIGGHAIIQAAAKDETIRALLVDGVGMNTLNDLLLIAPSETMVSGPLFWLAAPGYWVYDRMKELMSGSIRLEANRVLVTRIAPRPIFFISAGRSEERGLDRHYHSLAGPNALLWELPNTDHCDGIRTHALEYRQRMSDFFDANLLSE
jgi:pimeloyl-ACP methyl ester carboxylesterase